MEKAYNKTFTNGSNRGLSRFNACVGNNGLVDGKYFNGYDSSVKILLNSQIKNPIFIDTLIFPILFNARHAIELYLKDCLFSIYVLDESLGFIKGCNIEVDKIQKTHDLRILWQMFEENLIKIERRGQVYIDFQREYISDYFEIDLKGETFRYQYAKNNDVHLANTPVINIIGFRDRYTELSKSMNDLIIYLDKIKYMYPISSYTKSLSPNDLYKISKMLGDISTWKEEDFKEIKAAIKREYLIGSKELSEAISIIRETSEYSKFIGIENYIFHISKERIIDAIRIFEESINNYKEDFEKFKNFTIDELYSLCIMIYETGISTSKEYFNNYKHYRNTFSNEVLIDRIISKNSEYAIESIDKILKRFGCQINI